MGFFAKILGKKENAAAAPTPAPRAAAGKKASAGKKMPSDGPRSAPAAATKKPAAKKPPAKPPAKKPPAKKPPAKKPPEKKPPAKAPAKKPPAAAPKKPAAKAPAKAPAKKPAAAAAKKAPVKAPAAKKATTSSTGALPSLSERNSSNYTATDVEAAFRAAPAHKWKLQTYQFSGSLSFFAMGEQKEIKKKSIPQAIKLFQSNPAEYIGLMYQTSMKTWQPKDCQYTLIMRKGTTQLKPQGVDPSGWMTLMIHEYQQLPPLTELPRNKRDKYTYNMTHKGRKLPKPLLPGRGMGIADLPSLKIIGDIDPSDIHQGRVGDCWLLSAISAVAEFDGAIKKLFRKTKHIDRKPLDDGSINFYTISLYDLTTWKEVDIVIDESLCADPAGNGNLLASKPSEDGELWVCYLEKALAIHCGGWDEITGGQCTHAWAIMTGCKEQYTIARNPKTKKFRCMAKFNPQTKQWAKHYNSPHGPDGGNWVCPWPQVGGGGPATLELTEEQVYQRLCAFDRSNFIVGAGTKGLSDKNKTGGMVDNHAYSVIDCHPQVAGTKIDLLKVRNPWGSGEIEDGDFDDDGPGWDRYPQIKAELKPVVADDGIFYLTKDEFFQFFDHIYVSASNMTEFKED
ncbi:Calpain-type cysteine protease DEK1 [Seminavis robusta]|uniref:Calpain-type cysteine protease DEK1 n=1 Tax=Seminavis robusta TaxID=568900 RepID=A0A9N8DWK0_9STRA|nr:Calpain-type cysteine protease DEK1 [Seminavis robusta]|eukprot:Sro430_g141300.1 Calpain-type cysteine protease DEK1 (623) ;mRNA; f:30743-32611